ncbi:MAG: alpha/beta fold hydrolase [Candidatus Melainabacteria bacterium]|nr:alpha/beta fold hydrolase [Candidatus Melainabacteria bacterium]
MLFRQQELNCRRKFQKRKLPLALAQIAAVALLVSSGELTLAQIPNLSTGAIEPGVSSPDVPVVPQGSSNSPGVLFQLGESATPLVPPISRDQATEPVGHGNIPTADQGKGEADAAKKKATKKALAKGKPDKKKKRRGTPPCLAWVDSDVQPKAVLLCVHGLGLYNGTYEPFGLRMAKLGIATYAIDMRGFGSWMEAKGREKVDFDACMADVKSVLKVIHRAHPGLPVFLLGESMGGAIALQAAALYPELISGLISSVPSGDRFQQNRTSLKVALHLLANPNKPFDVGTQVVRQATQKPELREAWSKDPLARMNISAKELLQFQKFMNQNHKHAKKIQTSPVLIVQGCKDKLVRPEGTVELYNQLATPDRQLVLVPTAEHLIFEENQFNDDVVNMVSKWIDAHLAVKPATKVVGDSIKK